jgi:hypothetical protein
MIAYANGEEARPGGLIHLDGHSAVVEAVIDTESERATWGVGERGLMVLTREYGLLFQPVAMPDWPEVVLRSRADA